MDEARGEEQGGLGVCRACCCGLVLSSSDEDVSSCGAMWEVESFVSRSSQLGTVETVTEELSRTPLLTAGAFDMDVVGAGAGAVLFEELT